VAYTPQYITRIVKFAGIEWAEHVARMGGDEEEEKIRMHTGFS
jgi:hypothetical protein